MLAVLAAAAIGSRVLGGASEPLAAVPPPQPTQAASVYVPTDAPALPTPTPSATPVVTPSRQVSSPAATPSATATPKPSPKATPLKTPTKSATPKPSRKPKPTDRVDITWVNQTARLTGIPERALLAYASADLIIDVESPNCGAGWNTLAAIGAIESNHGRFGGSKLSTDGVARPPIIGVQLDGVTTAKISDTDKGILDRDAVWDRAVGPMQIIPSTWMRWRSDGNGDGLGDPQQIDDAALTAARYLCAQGSMATAEGWRRAVLSYNNSDVYVNRVALKANEYAQKVLG